MNKRHLALALLTCAVVSTPPTFATIITLVASSYGVGTNLSDPYPGITLENASHPESGPGFATSPLLIGTDAGAVAPALVRNTFGSYTDGSDCSSPFNSQCAWNAVYGVFTVPVYYISVETFGPTDDPVFLAAYDARGHLMGDDEGVGECFNPGGSQPSCGEFVQFVGVSSTTIPISYFLVGSFSAGRAYATEIFLGVQTTPEPASVALFAGGLLGILLARRRRSDSSKSLF